MKFFLLSVFFFLFIFQIHTAFAVSKTVTINWSTSGSIAEIKNYRMLYAYSRDMANPTVACETNDNSAKTITCNDIEISSEDVYFKIVATTSQSSTESNIQQTTIPVRTEGVQIGMADSPLHSGFLLKINDDFSIDTSTSYYPISGTISVYSGAIHGQRWGRTLVYHSKTAESPNQIVSATCSFTDNDYSGIAVRIDPVKKTGYFASLLSTGVTLSSFSNKSVKWLAGGEHSFTSPARLDLIITGNNIIVKVNGTVYINTSDSTYTFGNYCGAVINRGMTNADITVDDFDGRAK